MAASTSVFSEFEVKRLGFRFGTEDTFNVPCVGSIEEEMTVRKVTKKCRGVVKKRRNIGTGEGTLKVSAHIPYAVFVEMWGMNLTTTKTDVFAYGQNSRHGEFVLTADVFDEDGNELVRAYPVCMASAGPARKTTNGEEEVAEVEFEIEVSPDEYGNGVYECSAEVAKTTFTSVENWMTAFDSKDAQVETA